MVDITVHNLVGIAAQLALIVISHGSSQHTIWFASQHAIRNWFASQHAIGLRELVDISARNLVDIAARNLVGIAALNLVGIATHNLV